MKLLIVEDEKEISEPLKEALVDNGFVVDCVVVLLGCVVGCSPCIIHKNLALKRNFAAC